MKKFPVITIPAVLLSFAIMLFIPAASAQTSRNTQNTTEQTPQNTTLQNQPLQRSGMRTYTGFINKLDGQYMLTAPWTNMIYKLDNQQAAQKYNGQEVAITGNLDPKTSIIHIKNIADASKPGPKP